MICDKCNQHIESWKQKQEELAELNREMLPGYNDEEYLYKEYIKSQPEPDYNALAMIGPDGWHAMIEGDT